MEPHLTISQWSVVAVYCLLSMFWLILAILSGPYLSMRRPELVSGGFRRVQVAFVVISITLCIDSVYWAVTNTAAMLLPHLEHALRNPWFIASVKLLNLLAAIAFTFILGRARLGDVFDDPSFTKFADLTWDAIGILDPQGRVKIWNRGAETLYSWPRDEVKNRPIKDFLIPQSLQEESALALVDARTSRLPIRSQRTTRLKANGDEVQVDITISPIFDPDFKGYFGIMRESQPLPLATPRKFVRLVGEPTLLASEPYAFVVMPFSETIVHKDVWSKAIRGAASACGVSVFRADDEWAPAIIVQQVFSYIHYAKVVIVDLTGFTPNVFYELGLAHATNNNVIQLISGDAVIPVDVAAFKTIRYDVANLANLEDMLKLAIAAVLRNSSQ